MVIQDLQTQVLLIVRQVVVEEVQVAFQVQAEVLVEALLVAVVVEAVVVENNSQSFN